MTAKLSKYSAARVDRFVDDFIRSERVQAWASEKDSDFINEPERAARVADAPEGHCAVTHAEVIEDWRDAFDSWIANREHNILDRFCAAVHAHFDAVEEWHEKNGTLDQEIG